MCNLFTHPHIRIHAYTPNASLIRSHAVLDDSCDAVVMRAHVEVDVFALSVCGCSTTRKSLTTVLSLQMYSPAQPILSCPCSCVHTFYLIS